MGSANQPDERKIEMRTFIRYDGHEIPLGDADAQMLRDEIAASLDRGERWFTTKFAYPGESDSLAEISLLIGPSTNVSLITTRDDLSSDISG